MKIQENIKNIILKIIITICILLGILTWIPNLFWGRAEIYWVATIPLGIVALLCSLALTVKTRYEKIVCFTLSIILSLSFPILMFTGTMIEMFGLSIEEESTIIIPPANTKPIQVGKIFDIIDENNPQTYIIYFGRTNCESCNRFEDTLSQAIIETGTQVYYYNTEDMPRDESIKVIEKLGIEYVPVLMKVLKGKVIDYTADFDSENVVKWIRKEN